MPDRVRGVKNAARLRREKIAEEDNEVSKKTKSKENERGKAAHNCELCEHHNYAERSITCPWGQS